MREMKDSGIEWIGEIPKEWEIIRMKNMIISRDGGAWGEEKSNDENDVICLRIADFDYQRLRFKDTNELTIRNYKSEVKNKLLLLKDDILIEKSGGGEKTPVGRAVIFDKKYEALFANFMERLRTRNNVNPKYFLYILTAFYQNRHMLNYIKQTTGIQNLDISSLLSIERSPFSSISEQQKISTYLDNKCTKIDTIIEKQQTIIEKLKDYKLSRINEIVTNVDGIECHLGRISSMKNGLNFNMTLEGNKVKFLGVGDFKDYFVLNEKEMFSEIIITEEIPQEYLLENGDIVFVRSNGSKELVGRAVMVENIDFALTYSGFCIRFRNTRADLIDDKYLLYFFRSPYFRKQLERYSQGSNISNINQVLLSQISIIIPSPNYQITALETLDKLLSSIDSIINKKQALIEKLTEYKKSLIYEVVTGKKEV